MDLVVGTAGHIDHGKTALVKALTGVDADRLPEEKKRGITIDLGFADLAIGETSISFVDVPGHERFVKNMLAGAGGIDLVLLVVAADEGVMPQTREHFDICRLLGTKTGLVAITKTDLVEEDFLDLVELDVAELVAGSFLEDAQVIRTSSRSGKGIEELRAALETASRSLPERSEFQSTRLPIDRSFSVKGFGAVVTGTLVSGSIETGAEMELNPGEKAVRVRGIQTHGKEMDIALAGRRTAVNLAGIDHDQIVRGMTLSEPDACLATQIIDTVIEVLPGAAKPLRSRQRLRVHVGTSEVLARVDVLEQDRQISQGEKGFGQLRFESPVVVFPGDKFIVRSYSPQTTIAGGTVLDPDAVKHRKKDLPSVTEDLKLLEEEGCSPRALAKRAIDRAGGQGIGTGQIRRLTGLRKDVLSDELDRLEKADEAVSAEGLWLNWSAFEDHRRTLVDLLKQHHSSDPLSPGIARQTLREKWGAYLPDEIFRSTLASLDADGAIVSEKELVRIASHSRELSAEEALVLESLSRRFSEAGLEVPVLKDAIGEAIRGTNVRPDEARQIFQLLVDSAEVLKVTDELFFSKEKLAALTRKLSEFAENTAENRLISVPEFKDLAGISRKYAIPLLEYFDAIKVTRRAGNNRLILS